MVDNRDVQILVLLQIWQAIYDKKGYINILMKGGGHIQQKINMDY
jgi:hypothetical protein